MQYRLAVNAPHDHSGALQAASIANNSAHRYSCISHLPAAIGGWWSPIPHTADSRHLRSYFYYLQRSELEREAARCAYLALDSSSPHYLFYQFFLPPSNRTPTTFHRYSITDLSDHPTGFAAPSVTLVGVLNVRATFNNIVVVVCVYVYSCRVYVHEQRPPSSRSQKRNM